MNPQTISRTVFDAVNSSVRDSLWKFWEGPAEKTLREVEWNLVDTSVVDRSFESTAFLANALESIVWTIVDNNAEELTDDRD